MVGLMGLHFGVGLKAFAKHLNTFYICCNLYLIELSRTDIASKYINCVFTAHVNLSIEHVLQLQKMCCFTYDMK